MYYFAYGMNMNLKVTQYLKGRFVGIGKLPKHKFVYRTVADILPDETETVYGAVFKITKSIEEELDMREQYPNQYLKKNVTVTLEETGKTVVCMVYYMKSKFVRPYNPPLVYEKVVVNGAVDLKIPDWYIQKFLLWNLTLR